MNASLLALPLVAALVACAPAAQVGARWFPPAVPASATLDVVDLRTATAGEKLAATTLQGLVNRETPATAYLLLGEHDVFWLDDLQQRGAVTSTTTRTLDEFFTLHADAFAGVVVPDPALPATYNVATMMAGVWGAVVMEEAEVERLAGAKKVERLAGRWPTNLAAQQWAFEHLRPAMNPGILACYHPTSIPHHIRDYLVQQRVFTFWVTSEEKEDGVVSSYSAEKAFAEQLLAATPASSPVIGFWYSGADHGINEYHGVLLGGQHAVVTVPCDWGSNMSFLGGVGVDLPAAVRGWEERVAAVEKPPLDPAKVYLALDVIDSGDAAHYWQTNQYRIFQDPARGKVPINWSLGVATAELFPSVLAWHYEQASGLDTFFCGMSGLGYCFPYLGFGSKRPDPGAVLADYVERTAAAMPPLGLRDLVLYTDSWKPFDREANAPVTDAFVQIPGLRTMILGFGRDGDEVPEPNYLLNEALVSHTMTRWDASNVGRNEANNQWLADEIRRHTPPTRPAFLHVQAMSWTYYPSDLAEVLELLGPEYQALPLGHFDALCREHLAATPRVATSGARGSGRAISACLSPAPF
mgnify:CR=1 FL=1